MAGDGEERKARSRRRRRSGRRESTALRPLLVLHCLSAIGMVQGKLLLIELMMPPPGPPIPLTEPEYELHADPVDAFDTQIQSIPELIEDDFDDISTPDEKNMPEAKNADDLNDDDQGRNSIQSMKLSRKLSQKVSRIL